MASVIDRAASLLVARNDPTVDTPTDPAAGRAMRRHERLGMAFFGTWTLVGLFLDGWAHRTDKPETFFSPWHLVLYSGATGAIAWSAIDSRVRRRRGEDASPTAGERWTAIGITIFIAGAVTDFVWHEIFGVEADIEALLSPTHLALMFGGVLALGWVLRNAWATDGVADRAPTFGRFWPVALSGVQAAGVVSFFFMYASALTTDTFRWPMEDASRMQGVFADRYELAQIQGILAVLVSNAILIGLMLLLRQRWVTPPGTFTLAFTALGVGMAGLDGFERWPLAISWLVGGALADLLLARGASLRLAATAVPAAMWLAYFALFEMTVGVGWSVDLWGGTVFLALAEGGALSLLSSPMASASRAVLGTHAIDG